VPTEHHDYRALLFDGSCYRGDDVPEIAGNENVGQRGEESGKTAVSDGGRRRRRELAGRNLVRPALDRNGPDFREIRVRARTAFTAYGFGDG
jgi:hypothetical protein